MKAIKLFHRWPSFYLLQKYFNFQLLQFSTSSDRPLLLRRALGVIHRSLGSFQDTEVPTYRVSELIFLSQNIRIDSRGQYNTSIILGHVLVKSI